MSGAGTGPVSRRRGPVARAVLAVLGFYQRAISPALPPRCRFYPTCSAYAVEAVERHGAARGTWLALVRVLKCAPWHPGGVDLVPEPRGRHGAHGHHPEERGAVEPGAEGSGAEEPSAEGSGAEEPGAEGPGTEEEAHGTVSAAPSSTGGAPGRPTRATPPAASRTPQQEAGVA